MKTAADIMQSQVVTLSPDAPLHTAQRLFYEEGIHGAPVVDDTGRVLGMLTSTDLLRALAESGEVAPTAGLAYRDDLDVGLGGWHLAPDDFEERVRDQQVGDYMTEDIVSVAPDTPVAQIARSLRENGVHRVLVLERGELRGIVSTFDLVGLLEA